MRTLARIAIIAIVVAAGAMFGALSGQASSDAPWCAVINLGMGDARWDCSYRTVEECVPNVIGGDRGSCSPNPYGPEPAAAAPIKRAHKHHIRQEP